MTTHISARVAWHMDGWNGHVCKDPAANTYCVGCHSYPGEMIRERRDLAWEQKNAGADCADLAQMPPCMYSVNAFGAKALPVFSDPPEWFGQGAKRQTWQIPPATVCVWPYEQMYLDEVRKQDGTLDHARRLDFAKGYFDAIQSDRSLIFYYANYSNPFTEEDAPRYVVVGVSRVKKVGAQEYYEECSPEVQQRYAGGFVWQRNVTSHYPDEGLRLPFHAYQGRPDVLERMALFPDNPRNFKFGTRAFTDDEALSLVERFLEICGSLHALGDTSENWPVRIAWLQSLVAELWQGRGLYPGMATVLDALKFTEAIPFWKERAQAGQEEQAKAALFGFLDRTADQVSGLVMSVARTTEVRRAWRLREDAERTLLADCLPRFALSSDQLGAVLSHDRLQHGLVSSLDELADNPYLLCEQFVGDGPDDILPFYRIDHGMFPSPDLGAPFLAGIDDWRRLRGLCVEQLRRETRHSFLAAADVIHALNERLAYLPEWKRHQFTERYLEVDRDDLVGAMTFREKDGKTYLYLKPVYEAERVIETQLRALVSRADIPLRSPVTAGHWHNYLFVPDSTLAQRSPDDYEAAIQGQVQVCQRVFVRPVSVLSGSAGTGKTTVIRSLIQAVEKAHGAGTSFCLLAPTGKAADRIRSATGKEATTVHSFLARHGWLNPNMTFRASGGQQEDGFSTYIVDEASMLDLELAAALFRAIRWQTVQRLILVGDQSQLPPIGRGRLFADIMDWLEAEHGDSVAVLQTNVRQMENRVAGKGTGIQDLAAVYERTRTDSPDAGSTARAEEMLRRLQEGGDVDQDLRVEFWQGGADLARRLTERLIADMEQDTGTGFDADRPFNLWNAALCGSGQAKRADYHQVLSPYKAEEFGTESLNLILQKHANGRMLDRVGGLEGITLYDKVIQKVNRPKSRPVWAFNSALRKNEKVEVFNGEIGFVEPDLQDCKRGSSGRAAYLGYGFRLRRFQVLFARRPDSRVSASSASFVSENLDLAYAISCHKAQGSEFERVYFVVPKHKATLLSREMFYTGLTRARRHCTLLVEEDIAPLLTMYRPEASALLGINSSLFSFRPTPDALMRRRDWYAEGKVHRTLTDVMVRSKSEVIIANMLAERDVDFGYELPLTAPDGTFYLPDFTVTHGGETYYWEHLGRLDLDEYRNHWETKRVWYERNFPGRLLTTTESSTLSQEADALIQALVQGRPVSTLAVPNNRSSAVETKAVSGHTIAAQSPRAETGETTLPSQEENDPFAYTEATEDTKDAFKLRVRLQKPVRGPYRLKIYDGDTYLGEYERSTSRESAVAKAKEIKQAAHLLLAVFQAHGPFVVRWNSTERRKEIRASDGIWAEVWGVIPSDLWRSAPPQSGGASPKDYVIPADQWRSQAGIASDRRIHPLVPTPSQETVRPQEAAETTPRGIVSYEATRLTFLADRIEPLQPADVFRVVTPVGTFEMTKDDFYTIFDNVVESDSYQHGRVYHYPTVPRKALAFQIKA